MVDTAKVVAAPTGVGVTMAMGWEMAVVMAEEAAWASVMELMAKNEGGGGGGRGGCNGNGA